LANEDADLGEVASKLEGSRSNFTALTGVQ